MQTTNQGFSPKEIEKLNKEMATSGKTFVLVATEDNSEDFVNFWFIGKYEGKEVIYDAVIYTLRVQHSSEIYELAEHRAAQRFPEYQKITYEEDENGDIEPLDSLEEEIGLFMAEVIEELEEEEAVKVKEHVDMDEHVDFGIGLDIGLNVEEVTEEVIVKFIKDFNDDNLQLDPTLYSFAYEGEEV